MPINPVPLLPLLTNGMKRTPRPPMFRPMDIATSGMSVQRMRMETVATNIANAETTHTEAGGPYRRRFVSQEETVRPGAAPAYPALPIPGQALGATPTDPTDSLGGVSAVAIEEDPSEGPMVYDPGHPDADANGYVRYPNVRVTDEMVDLMEAKRVYEANATVFTAAKQLLRRAIDI
ncbi:MAG: flagellar basal body rod protein FlgC [Gemmatimonadaceae bacterium]